MARKDLWSRDQLLLALRLYMRLTFGKLDQRNPAIIALAERIGRTPGASLEVGWGTPSANPIPEIDRDRGSDTLDHLPRRGVVLTVRESPRVFWQLGHVSRQRDLVAARFHCS